MSRQRGRAPGGPRFEAGALGRPRAEAGVKERDQAETAFTPILSALVGAVPGARAAVLVDRDGETVDYAGAADPFALRLAAAHWRIVLNEVREQPALSGAHWLFVRARRRSVVASVLPDGYALVVHLAPTVRFMAWSHALQACARSLALEAGWSGAGASTAMLARFPASVLHDERGRPCAVRLGSDVRRVDVLGMVGGPSALKDRRGSAAARAWRVRLDSGVEAMLLQDASGEWSSDEPLDALGATAPSSDRPPHSSDGPIRGRGRP